MSEEKKPKKPPVDWEAVEREYRAGVKSLKMIGADFGVSDAGIIKRARKEGWTRNLGAKIQAKAEALVSAGVVSAEVSAQTTKLIERQVIDANAELLANVMRGHRKDVGRLRGVVSVLLEKVESILNESDLFKQIGEVCFSPDDNGIDKVNELYRKVIELPTQTDTTKKLAETMKVLIELERKVFKLDTLPEGGDDDAKKAGAEAGRAVAAGVDAAMAALAAKVAEAKAK